MVKNIMVLPDDIKRIMQLIIDNGYECYLVGGAVRDYILNVESKDYDFSTNIPFDKIKDIISGLTIMKENEHRNTAVVRMNNYDVEFSMFRGKNLKEDLYNRDFTINSIAVDVNGNFIDYYNGIQSINNKTISLLKVNGEGFGFDSLRILRAIRLALKYNFIIDENTKKKMLSKKYLLNYVSFERILDEVKKILIFDNVDYYLMEYKEIFFEIIPELKRCDGFNQCSDYHIYDVYTHIVNVVKNTPKNIYLRLAALFHDIGKPERFVLDDNQTGHFLGHAEVSCNIFKDFCRKYKLDNKTTKIVSDLILYHENDLSSKYNKIYNFYKKYNMDRIELLFELRLADIKSQNPDYLYRIENLKSLEEIYIEVRNKYKLIEYNGDNLIKLGYKGKIIGEILDDVKRQIINNRFNNVSDEIDKYVLKVYGEVINEDNRV